MIARSDAIKEQIAGYYDFWFGIHAAYESWAKERGLTVHSLFILYMIQEKEGECTQKMICQRLLLPKQTVHTILNAFETNGLIVRTVDESDRRNRTIVFTEKGRDYAEGILEELSRIEKQTLLRMEPQDRQRMAEINRRFLGHFRAVLEEET